MTRVVVSSVTEQPTTEEAPEPKPDQKPQGAYEAVVYFHGMGDQRRYAEIGRLIDAFDQYAQPGRRREPTGTLRELEGRFDEPRADQDQLVIGHAELQHVTDSGRRRFRFYEAYWAPEAAEGVPVHEVVAWLATNLLRPIGLLFSIWREHFRLRLTFLDLAVSEEEVYYELAEKFWHFGGAAGRRVHRRGSFRQFTRYLREEETELKPNDLVAGAKKWRRVMVMRALQYQVVLLSLALAVVLVLLALTVAVLWALESLGARTPMDEILGDMFEPSWTNALSIVSTAILALGLERFLSRSLGDVVFWATRETDKRHQVHAGMLDVGISTLRQVIEDARCTRVVVIAHSLGTPVAYESLLALGRFNKAFNRADPGGGPLPIDKLDQFITLASPIDKLHFFFESHHGGGRAYSRLLEKVHGDVGEVPFTRNRHPQIHWINFWDKADVVSGPISSPNRLVSGRGIRPVDNVEVATTWLPDPGKSHSAYFADCRVVERAFDAVFFREYTYADPPRMGDGADYPDQPNYDSQTLADIGTSWLTRPFQTVIVFLPWLIGLVWLEGVMAWTAPFRDQIRTVTLVIVILIAALVAGGRFIGIRNPIKPPVTSNDSPTDRALPPS